MARRYVRRRGGSEREAPPELSGSRRPSPSQPILSVHQRVGNEAVTRVLQRQDKEGSEPAWRALTAADPDLRQLLWLSSQPASLEVQAGPGPEAISSAGQVAVMRQPEERPAAVETKPEPVNPALEPVLRDVKGVAEALRRKLVVVSDPDERKGYPQQIKSLEAFPTTHKLPLIALRARVMPKPQFLGRALDAVRRAEEVEVLGAQGSWYKVRSPRGKEGWMHRVRLIPKVVFLRSGETGSGTTGGEGTIGGRA